LYGSKVLQLKKLILSFHVLSKILTLCDILVTLDVPLTSQL